MEVGETLARSFEAGGRVALWLIAALAAVALALVVERAIAVGRARINVNEFLAKLRKALIVNRSLREGVKICEEQGGPVPAIVKAGLLKYGRPADEVEMAIEGAVRYETGRLERGLTVLATVARVAPLLGLLGAVLLLAAAFRAAADAGSSLPGPAAVASALAVAAAGLVVAIPLEIAYNYFDSRVNKFGRDIDAATDVLSETLAEMERGDAAAEAALPSAGSGSRSAGKA